MARRRFKITRMLAVILAVMLAVYNVPAGAILTAFAQTDKNPGVFTLQLVDGEAPVANQAVAVFDGEQEIGIHTTDENGVAAFSELTNASLGADKKFRFATGTDTFEISLEEQTTAHYIYDVGTKTVTRGADQVMYQVSLAAAPEHGQVKLNGTPYTKAVQVKAGSDVKLEAVSDENYEIQSVTINGEAKEIKNASYKAALSGISKDTVIDVKFVLKSYTITFESNGNGDIKDENGQIIQSVAGKVDVEVQDGKESAFTAIPNQGYLVKEILVDGKAVGLGTEAGKVDSDGYRYSFGKVDKNHSVQVTFDLKTYKVTVDSGIKNGSVSVSPSTVAHGGQTTVTMRPEDLSYQVAELLINNTPVPMDEKFVDHEDNSTTYTISNVTSDISVTAVFEKVQDLKNAWDTYVSINPTSGEYLDSFKKGKDQALLYSKNAQVTIAPQDPYNYVSLSYLDLGPIDLILNWKQSHTISSSTSIEQLFVKERKGVKRDIGRVDFGGKMLLVFDKKAPHINKPEVKSDEQAEVDGSIWHSGKVNVSFTVENEEETFEGITFASGIDKVYYTKGNYSQGTVGAEIAPVEGRYSFTTDDEDYKGVYSIWAVDKAGNMSDVQTVDINIDKTLPVLADGKAVEFQQRNDSAFAEALHFLSFGTFFKKEITVKVKAKKDGSGIKEISLHPSNSKITVKPDGEIRSVGNGTAEEATFTVQAEEVTGSFTAEIMDRVGNKKEYLITKDNSNIAADNSGVILFEENEPSVSIQVDQPEGVHEHNSVYSGDVTYKIAAGDEDSGLHAVAITINGKEYKTDEYAQLAEKKTAAAFEIQTKDWKPDEKGAYRIVVAAVDNAGNTKQKELISYVDKTGPIISGFRFSVYDEVSRKYEDLKDEAQPHDMVEPATYGFYFKQPTKVTVQAEDLAPANEHASGVQSMVIYLRGNTGTYQAVKQDGSLQEVSEADLGSITPVNAADSKFTFSIPEVFKGQIIAKAIDYVQNTGAPQEPDAAVLENKQKHEEEKHIALERPAAVFKDADGKDLYADDVNVQLTVTDTYSGLKQVEWFVEGDNDKANNQSGKVMVNNNKQYEAGSESEGWSQTKTDSNLVHEMKKTLVVKNNSNRIRVRAVITDRAGNVSAETQEFSIDKTVPEIQVTYDNDRPDADHKDFYKKGRTATIKVMERNFNPKAVQHTITNTAGAIPELSSWETAVDEENPDRTIHTATIHYAADGDYTFDIAYKDAAGNAAAPFQQQKFTLDQTKPELQVSYDNNNAANGNYYNANRTATLIIKEHNFDPSRVRVTGSATNNGKPLEFPQTSEWMTNGDTHTATIVYQGDAKYSFDIDFRDKAGNDADDYKAEEFYVDKTVPVLADGSKAVTFTQENGGTIAKILNLLTFGTFFNKQITVQVKAQDLATGVEKIELRTSDGKVIPQVKPNTWKQNGLTGEVEFTVDADRFEGTFTAEVTDLAHNTEGYLITHLNSNMASEKSAAIMFEKEKPSVNIEVIPHEGVQYSGNKEYNGDVTYKVKAVDPDSGVNTVEINVNGKVYTHHYSDGAEKQTAPDVPGISTDNGDIAINDDGSFVVAVKTIDNAGNETEQHITTYRDKTKPRITDVSFFNRNSKGGYDRVGEPASLQSTVELTGYGFYFEEPTRVTIKAVDGKLPKDHASGVQSITAYLQDYENGKYYAVLKGGGLQEIQESAIGKITPVAATEEITFNVPAAFKGQIFTKATDRVYNTSAFQTPDGTIVENAEKHADEGDHIQLEKAVTSYKDNNGMDLYAGNVDVKLTVTDTYSGIGQIEWSVEAPYDTANNQRGTVVLNNDKSYAAGSSTEGWTQTRTEKNLVYEMTKVLNVKNNSNSITVNVKMTDRAGNTSEKKLSFSIDKTAPEIKVTYDNNRADAQNAEFYKENRTATIIITERNFRAEDAKHLITNTDGKIPALSGWRTTANPADPDETTHTATILYEADGDYTFDIAYKDNAGNAAAPFAQQKFTIDKTKPQVKVSYSNSAAANGNYYKAARTATISMTEHNFNPSRIKITGSASDKGAAISFPQASGWTANGDVHTATVTYQADGKYSFDIDFTDMAGNVMDDYKTEEFYVDKTAPALAITGVQDKSANNGDVVPVVTYSDTNFNKNAAAITLTGANREKVELDGSYADVPNGQAFTFRNFKKEKEVDDIYTLTARLTDLAGNETKQTIAFSVNRFGSVYVFDNSLQNIDGKYVKNERDITLTETNVDSLKEGSIRVKMTKNGTPSDLKEGADYTVAKSGGNGKWSQYQYTVKKTLFAGDGRYTVALYSEDAAGNVNENIDETKRAEISFGIDKTAPVIVPIDLENGQQYAVDRKTASVSIKDNLVLQNASIYLNDEKVTYKASGESYTFEIPGSNQKQDVTIKAVDAAGNELVAKVDGFLVTTNVFARWYNNTALFVGSLIGIGTMAMAIAGYFILSRNKRAVREEETIGG
ncbi:Ig-like domain-containing protein [Ectobacillus ponti]|uniref:Ig-like domain-containing protein n=1 Tax=Ectobacillus ponti TaxID=2961894 RepID=A0AA42BRD7_9BACI|nr:Ig-like domain-containing protein [Ectobacillus ponti]MCP8969384.1 Ig-like domain-containing protein [Ectobacillus ponti]